MNLDEFLRQTEELADECEGASPHRVYKLLALVRKLREQRDGRFNTTVVTASGSIAGAAWADSEVKRLVRARDESIARMNADLDEIVRET